MLIPVAMFRSKRRSQKQREGGGFPAAKHNTVEIKPPAVLCYMELLTDRFVWFFRFLYTPTPFDDGDNTDRDTTEGRDEKLS